MAPTLLRSTAAAVALLASVVTADEVYHADSQWLAGAYGAAPVQTFMSSNLTPPAMNIEVAPTAASNYSLLSYRGTATTQPAPLIMDSNGSLIWSGTLSRAETSFGVPSQPIFKLADPSFRVGIRLHRFHEYPCPDVHGRARVDFLYGELLLRGIRHGSLADAVFQLLACRYSHDLERDY